MQFEKAEYQTGSGQQCTLCAKPIDAEYYHLAGQVICPECADKVKLAQAQPGQRLVVQGALYALGAAVISAIGYAIILVVTGYELALIAIAVGWFIGQAARRGTKGLGGRAVQIIAVACTYIAICGSLFFQVVYQLNKEGKPLDLLAYPIMAVMSLGKPFFELADGFSGILGLLILFWGMQQAWRQTGNVEGLLMGPYQVEASQAAATPNTDATHG